MDGPDIGPRYVATDQRGGPAFVVLDLARGHRELCTCNNYGDAVDIANALVAADRDPETVEDL
jgi:hypothetical protein